MSEKTQVRQPARDAARRIYRPRRTGLAEYQAPQKVRKDWRNFAQDQPGTSFVTQTEAVGSARVRARNFPFSSPPTNPLTGQNIPKITHNPIPMLILH